MIQRTSSRHSKPQFFMAKGFQARLYFIPCGSEQFQQRVWSSTNTNSRCVARREEGRMADINARTNNLMARLESITGSLRSVP